MQEFVQGLLNFITGVRHAFLIQPPDHGISHIAPSARPSVMLTLVSIPENPIFHGIGFKLNGVRRLTSTHSKSTRTGMRRGAGRVLSFLVQTNFRRSVCKRDRVVTGIHCPFKIDVHLGSLWPAHLDTPAPVTQSPLPIFRFVDLGRKHDERLREMLLTGDPGEPWEYGCSYFYGSTKSPIKARSMPGLAPGPGS